MKRELVMEELGLEEETVTPPLGAMLPQTAPATKKYNKLVRDYIPGIIEERGVTPKTRICASDEEYEQYLMDKLGEEVNEFMEKPSLEEMADIREVLYAIAHLRGWSHYQIVQAEDSKRLKSGGITKRIILEEA